jgi:hypothetical protein
MGVASKLLTKAGPWFVKQLPKLWPLLLEAKNRERVLAAVQNLASQSPTKRLKAKVEVTAVIAEQLGTKATSDDERQRAAAWSVQARNLALRLDMPMTDRQARRAHRASIEQQLVALQTEMDRWLDQPVPASGTGHLVLAAQEDATKPER